MQALLWNSSVSKLLLLAKVNNFCPTLIKIFLMQLYLASSPLYYITALTSLFEGVAMIVDQHQPVVEKYYGPGKMKSVVSRLLEECDRVTQILKDGWEEDRAMQRKVWLLISFTLVAIHEKVIKAHRCDEQPPNT